MFEWDEYKSRRNLQERGFDCEYAAGIFEGDTIEWDDTRRDYGERRIIAIGLAEGVALTIVYSQRGEAQRIISARRSNRSERLAYNQALDS